MSNSEKPYLNFPYKIEELHWNENHTRNKENIYCYCGKNIKENESFIKCQECGQLFHSTCIKILKQPQLIGDIYYFFKCSVCNKGKEIYIRNNISWITCLYLVIYNIVKSRKDNNENKNIEKNYYCRFKEDICEYIDNNWDYFFPNKFRPLEWINIINNTLLSNPTIFISEKKNNYWTLKSFDINEFEKNLTENNYPSIKKKNLLDIYDGKKDELLPINLKKKRRILNETKNVSSKDQEKEIQKNEKEQDKNNIIDYKSLYDLNDEISSKASEDQLSNATFTMSSSELTSLSEIDQYLSNSSDSEYIELINKELMKGEKINLNNNIKNNIDSYNNKYTMNKKDIYKINTKNEVKNDLKLNEGSNKNNNTENKKEYERKEESKNLPGLNKEDTNTIENKSLPGLNKAECVKIEIENLSMLDRNNTEIENKRNPILTKKDEILIKNKEDFKKNGNKLDNEENPKEYNNIIKKIEAIKIVKKNINESENKIENKLIKINNNKIDNNKIESGERIELYEKDNYKEESIKEPEINNIKLENKKENSELIKDKIYKIKNDIPRLNRENNNNNKIKNNEINNNDIKNDEIKTDDIKNNDIKNDDIKNNDIKNEEIKTDDIKPNDIKNNDEKNNDIKNDNIKKDEIKNDDIKNDIDNDGTNNDGTNNDGTNNDYIKNDDIKINNIKINGIKSDNINNDEIKNDHMKNDIKINDKRINDIKISDIKNDDILNKIILIKDELITSEKKRAIENNQNQNQNNLFIESSNKITENNKNLSIKNSDINFIKERNEITNIMDNKRKKENNNNLNTSSIINQNNIIKSKDSYNSQLASVSTSSSSYTLSSRSISDSLSSKTDITNEFLTSPSHNKNNDNTDLYKYISSINTSSQINKSEVNSKNVLNNKESDISIFKNEPSKLLNNELQENQEKHLKFKNNENDFTIKNKINNQIYFSLQKQKIDDIEKKENSKIISTNILNNNNSNNLNTNNKDNNIIINYTYNENKKNDDQFSISEESSSEMTFELERNNLKQSIDYSESDTNFSSNSSYSFQKSNENISNKGLSHPIRGGKGKQPRKGKGIYSGSKSVLQTNNIKFDEYQSDYESISDDSLNEDSNENKIKKLKDIPIINLEKETLVLKQLKNRLTNSKIAQRIYRKLQIRKIKRTTQTPIFNIDKFMKNYLASKVELSPISKIKFKRNQIISVKKTEYKNSFKYRLFGKSLDFKHSLDIPIISKYTGIKLMPYIYRNYDMKPPKLKLLEDIVTYYNRNNPKWKKPKSAPIDFVHLQNKHVNIVNEMLCQAFWPGINVSEQLMFPDFSIIAMYKHLIIGCAFITPEAYITYIYVRPEWGNSGIGKFMLYYLIQSCIGKDITLHVSANNKAMLLYQKFGFKAEEFNMNFYEKYLPADSTECKNAFLLRLRR